jgi:hypothetical protein
MILSSRILVTELKQLTVTKSSNHTLSLHRSTFNSSSTTTSGHSALPLELCNLTAQAKVKVKVKVKVTLRLAVYRQSVRLGVKPLETHDQIFFVG